MLLVGVVVVVVVAALPAFVAELSLVVMIADVVAHSASSVVDAPD